MALEAFPDEKDVSTPLSTNFPKRLIDQLTFPDCTVALSCSCFYWLKVACVTW